jgi:hypothetical protein
MKRVLGIACCALLVGCSSVVVYKAKDGESDPSDKTKQPGIPFYVKKAEVVHTTKIRVEQASIRFNIEYPQKKATFAFPSAGPISVHGNRCLDEHVTDITDNLDKMYVDDKTDPDWIIETLSNYRRKLEDCNKDPLRQTVEVNTWKTGATIDTTRYWLNPKLPIMGSTTVSAELASDGTLTKASVAVQDDTISTLISLLPITKYFERRLGLSGDTSGKTAEDVKHKIGYARFAGRPKRPGEEVKVSMEVKLEPTVYTLEEHLPAKSCSKSCTPLELVFTDSGFKPCRESVQLVSVETSSDAKKDDDTAYSISGKIVPPKPKTDAPAVAGSP